MKIRKYRGSNGGTITQVSLSDEDIESRLSKRKELSQDELEFLCSIDGQQRTYKESGND